MDKKVRVSLHMQTHFFVVAKSQVFSLRIDYFYQRLKVEKDK